MSKIANVANMRDTGEGLDVGRLAVAEIGNGGKVFSYGKSIAVGRDGKLSPFLGDKEVDIEN